MTETADRQREAVSAPPAGRDQGGAVLGFAIGFLVGLQLTPLPLNLAIVDILLTALVGARIAAPGSSDGRFRWMAPWLWLIALGSFIGMFSTPLIGASMLHMLRDVYAFSIFIVAAWWLARGPVRWRAMLYGMVAVGCLCSALVIVSPDIRPTGTFQNPNYVGHYLALVAVLVLATRKGLPRWMLGVVPALLLGMLGSGSFGGILMAVTGIAYLGWSFGSVHGLGRVVVRVILVAVVVVVAFQGLVGDALDSNFALDNGFGENRFQKTSTGRVDRYEIGLRMAQEYPFGVGPGGALYVEQSLLDHELHNDYLAFLVERTALGLIGLLGLLIGMWRRFAPGGAARAVLAAVMIGSMVRETLNFRHLWLALAIAVVFDTFRTRFETRGMARDRVVGDA